MSEPLLALQGAVVATLSGDPALGALLGGAKIFEHAAATIVAPFIAFDELAWRDIGTSSGPMREHRLALLCVSRQPGTKEALAMAERAAALLDNVSLALDGHRLVSLAVTAMEIQRVAKDQTRKARLRLRAVTEPL